MTQDFAARRIEQGSRSGFEKGGVLSTKSAKGTKRRKHFRTAHWGVATIRDKWAIAFTSSSQQGIRESGRHQCVMGQSCRPSESRPWPPCRPAFGKDSLEARPSESRPDLAPCRPEAGATASVDDAAGPGGIVRWGHKGALQVHEFPGSGIGWHISSAARFRSPTPWRAGISSESLYTPG